MSPKTDIIFLSVKQRHAMRILNGTKNVDFRKESFPTHCKKAILYATLPLGMVLGTVEIEVTENFPKDSLLNFFPDLFVGYVFCEPGITRSDMIRYYRDDFEAGRGGTLLLLKKPVAFKIPFHPRSLWEYWNVPQSYRYLSEEQYQELCLHGEGRA